MNVYERLPGRLSHEQVAGLVDLSQRVDLRPGPGGARITPFDVADVPWLDPPPDRAWFVALYPSAQLVAHADAFDYQQRLHVPILLNPGCWVFHEGTWQQLEIGVLYRMDPTRIHGAVNWGDAVRIHLIIDYAEISGHAG